MNTLNLMSFQRPTDAERRDGWVGEVVRPEMGGEPICSFSVIQGCSSCLSLTLFHLLHQEIASRMPAGGSMARSQNRVFCSLCVKTCVIHSYQCVQVLQNFARFAVSVFVLYSLNDSSHTGIKQDATLLQRLLFSLGIGRFAQPCS